MVYLLALEYRKKEDYASNTRVATWAIVRTLRYLNRFDEALVMPQAYDTVGQSGNYDTPIEMFTLTRGWVYAELAEIYTAQAKQFARFAYDDLSNNEMFKTTASERLDD